MRFVVGIDDTDSSKGYCTTYLAYRIAVDLGHAVRVLPYPKLVRLNPNIPFKTRGNAAVCLEVEATDPDTTFNAIAAKVEELSDVRNGANSGMVFLDDPSRVSEFRPLYLDALTGVVNPHKVRRLIGAVGARWFELGNGMGVVGAAASIGFDEGWDHTYELVAYRRKEHWGTGRFIDGSSVKEMDAQTFPHTYNNYDYQKGKVLVAPHGPDPVFAGIRGDSPSSVIGAFAMLRYHEPLAGHMVYASNQHTDAHLRRRLDWKAYSSGWTEGTVGKVDVGEGGHVYVTIHSDGVERMAAAYEPTGDLKRAVKLLKPGDRIRVFGGVRRATPIHTKILNLEKLEVVCPENSIPEGIYISSPRANRHLTKPLIRYGNETKRTAGTAEGWLVSQVMRQPMLA